MATAKKSGTRKAAGTAAKKTPAKKKPAKKASAPKKTSAKKTPAKSAKKTAKAASVKTTAKKTGGSKAGGSKAGAKPKKAAKSPFGKKFINEMKERLLAERAKYLHSAEEYRAEADALIEGREPGDVQFDEESGEGDTLAVERERDLALSAQARAAVEQIDAALERIEKNTYGLCVTSGLPIPQDRLRAIPWAAERVEYKVGGLGRL